MNLSGKARRKIILGIGVALILFGLIQGIFNLEVSESFSKNFSLIMVMAALVLLFSGIKKEPQSEDENNEQEQKDDEQKEDQDEENQLYTSNDGDNDGD
jgi:threonine/homoserine/homoserine lactone efflux protein